MVSLPRRIATFAQHVGHGLLLGSAKHVTVPKYHIYQVLNSRNCVRVPKIPIIPNSGETMGGGWVASLNICTREKLVFFSTGGSLLSPGFPASSGSPVEILIRILRGEPHRGARGKAGKPGESREPPVQL